MRTLVAGGRVLTPAALLPDHAVVMEDGRIVSITRGRPEGSFDRVIDASGMWVVPGFIDVHVHGGDGFDAMDATPEALLGMGRFFARHGVTAYYATTTSAPADSILAAIETVMTTPQPRDGARHLGVHVEGPYLNPAHCGAQQVSDMRDPDPEEYGNWLESGVVKLVTVAPERPGVMEFIREGAREGVEFAVGHSGASYEQMLEAANHGLRQATHTYNGMLGLHHREPGTLGAIMTDDRIYGQLICDGIHVHPAMVKLLIRAKGAARTILITDSIRAAGLPDGEYDIGDGQIATVRNGIVRVPSGSLAGSTLTMDAAVRNAIAFTGMSLQEVLPMATSVPAEAMGLAGKKGVLAVGADADLVLLDPDLCVRMTLVAGEVVYRAGQEAASVG